MLVRYPPVYGEFEKFSTINIKTQLPLQIFLEEATVLFWRVVFLQPQCKVLSIVRKGFCTPIFAKTDNFSKA